MDNWGSLREIIDSSQADGEPPLTGAACVAPPAWQLPAALLTLFAGRFAHPALLECPSCAIITSPWLHVLVAHRMQSEPGNGSIGQVNNREGGIAAAILELDASDSSWEPEVSRGWHAFECGGRRKAWHK